MEVNVFGMLAMAKALAPVLRHNGGGVIVGMRCDRWNSVQSGSDMQQTAIHGAGGGMDHALEGDVEVTSTQFEIAKMQISLDNEALLVGPMRV